MYMGDERTRAKLLTRRAGAVYARTGAWNAAYRCRAALDIESLSFTSFHPAFPSVRARVLYAIRAHTTRVITMTMADPRPPRSRAFKEERTAERERETNFEAALRWIVSCINARHPGRIDLPPSFIPPSTAGDYSEQQLPIRLTCGEITLRKCA